MQKFENENFFFQGKLNILLCSRRHSVFDNDDDEDVNPHTKKNIDKKDFLSRKIQDVCFDISFVCTMVLKLCAVSQSVSKRSVTDRKIVNLSPIHKTKRKRKMNTHNKKKPNVRSSDQTKLNKRNETK